MDIKALIKANLPEGVEITDRDIGIIAKEIKTAVGDEFVPKTEYGKKAVKVDELQKQVESLQGDSAEADAWKTKYEDAVAGKQTLQEQFDQYKAEQEKTFNEFKQGVESEKQTAQIQSALSDRLIKDGANPKLVKLLLKDIDTTKAELKDGDIANYDDLTKTVKEGYSEVFGTQKTEGAGVANPPANNGGEQKPEFKFDFTPVRAVPQNDNKGVNT